MAPASACLVTQVHVILILTTVLMEHLRVCQSMYLRWFSGHLDSSLEDGDGEPRVGGTAQPQSEVNVGLLDL